MSTFFGTAVETFVFVIWKITHGCLLDFKRNKNTHIVIIDVSVTEVFNAIVRTKSVSFRTQKFQRRIDFFSKIRPSKLGPIKYEIEFVILPY